MDAVPGWHIGILFFLYGGEYVLRAMTQKDKRYIYIGKASGRLLLAGIYFYFALFPAPAELRFVWIRYGLVVFLLIDLFFVLQERLMARFIR